MDDLYKGTDILLLLENARKHKPRYMTKKEDSPIREHLFLTDDPEGVRRFFDYYVRLESWIVYDEALAICVCADPHWWTEVNREIYFSWAHQVLRILHFKDHGLKVLNPDAPREEWRVDPKVFVGWLIDKGLPPRKELIDIFSSSLQKQASKAKSTHGNAELNAQRREKVLRAALAILATYPKKCEVRGKISAPAIVRIMEEKSPLWFEDGEMPASRTIEDLIRNSLKTLRSS